VKIIHKETWIIDVTAIAVLLVLFIIGACGICSSCASDKGAKKDDKLEEPKNGEEEGPAWSKFPMPDEEEE
jgi:hypothetical protein